jgi:hypothetical protein
MRAAWRFGRSTLVLAALALFLGEGGRAGAAIITWNSATGSQITGDSDVATTGTLVIPQDALNIGSPGVPPTTINGVTFQGAGFPNGTSVNAFGRFVFLTSGTFFSGNSIQSFAPPFANLSSSYQQLLASIAGVGGEGAQFTLTINGLTVGERYEFQWWLDDSQEDSPQFFTTATAGNTVTLSSNTGNPDGGLGKFALGTFTADTASEVITFAEDGGFTHLAGINGLQLRDLGRAPPSPTIPEPSSLALFGLGGLGLAGWRRWRRTRNRQGVV